MDEATSSGDAPVSEEVVAHREQPSHVSVDGLEDSQDGSLYYPPDDEDRFSEGYHSFGDTDFLGSVGDLVERDVTDWDTLETDLVPEYLADASF